MTLTLTPKRVEGGVEFRGLDGATAIEPAAWALADAARLASGQAARVGVLLRLLEDEQAELRNETRVFLSHAVVAQIDETERRQIGLPASPNIAIELRTTGAFSDPDFQIDRRLIRSDGRAIVAPSLDGCFLRIGDEEFVLSEPLFSLWEAVGRFNAHGERDLESRYRDWAQIADQLPEGVRLGEDLQTLRIVLATGFSLNPFRNANGEPDFEPVLGRWTEGQSGLADPARVFSEALPRARQEDFAKRFRGLSSVKHRYLAGSSHFVVLSDRVEKALHVVHEVQHADAGVRRRFLTRPSAFLRDALAPPETEAGADPTEDVSVDDVFFDEGLSERVKGVGIWEPKVLPWLKPSGESWLPEDSGLSIDGELVHVPAKQAPELLEKIRAARGAGQGSVDHNGTPIPATEATEKALEELIQATRSDEPAAEPVDGEVAGRRAKLALLIIDNLEQLGFRMESRGARTGTNRTPANLETQLLPHQRTGLDWLQQHWTSGSPGAVLADDMGLGKTLQSLAFLAWLSEEMQAGAWPRRPFLVVAPTGLLRNWRDEHDKHLGGAGLGDLLEAFGSGLRGLRSAQDVQGRELATGLPSLNVAALTRSAWVMTTYETLRDYQHSFGRVHWCAVIFDEAQKIKNPAAGLTEAAKAMKQDFTLAMTGTPVENRVEDLWCIVDRVRPGGLGALKDFSARFRTEAGGDPAAALGSLRDELLEGASPSAMLRRLKEDHLQGLPAKEIHAHQRPMPPAQASAYRAAVDAARHGASMLQVLQHLRAISLHPTGLVDQSDQDFVSGSARLSLAFELLDDIRDRGEKALVFLESRAIQDALAEILQRRYRLRDPILIINGDVAGSKRKARVDEFQGRSGFDVMILSPRAGGVGLTVTAANHVIHLARWWNPAVEDQCTDRVHRIGQTRTVHVHQVMAVHPEIGDRSFDLRLAALLDRKRQLNRAVLAPTAATQGDFEELYRTTVLD